MSVWILVLAVAVGAWAWSVTHPSPLALVPATLRSRDLAPLQSALAKASPGAQPTEYDRVLKRLWDTYERELAAQLARDFATRRKDAPVSQYWLRKLMEHEPGIASRVFDDEFLARYYDASVAAGCGKCGSCSCH